MNQIVSPETFLDLEIHVLPLRKDAYPVELIVAREQSFRGEMTADLDPSILYPADLRVTGQALFHALLKSPDLQRGWDQAIGRSQKRRIRLNIDPAAPELHKLPWELLCDNEGWLAATAGTPFSRYLPVERPWGRPARQQPFRLLVALSNPVDLAERYPRLAPVDLEAERRTIEDSLSGPDRSVQVEFLNPPVTLARLETRLQEGFGGLHITGHGALNPLTNSTAVLLQDETGKIKLAVDEQVSNLLARLPDPPRLIFLMACESSTRSSADAFTGLAARLVRDGVPAVVAMQGAISMSSGQSLAGAFYRRLAAHGQVDLAVNEARSTLITANRPDAHLPVLFMRLASGRLWEETPAEKPPPARLRPGRTINTGGGAYIEGNLNTGGGDFVGRDKITYTMPSTPDPVAFRAIRRLVAQEFDPDTRADLENAITRLEAEARKGLDASEERVLQWLNFLSSSSPQIWRAAMEAFQESGSSLPAAFRRAAGRSN